MATKMAMMTSPCCVLMAVRARRHGQQLQRATAQPHDKEYTEDYYVDLGMRSVLPHITSVAVLEHASASQQPLLPACLATAASQHTTMEAHTSSNANMNLIATTAAGRPTIGLWFCLEIVCLWRRALGIHGDYVGFTALHDNARIRATARKTIRTHWRNAETQRIRLRRVVPNIPTHGNKCRDADANFS